MQYDYLDTREREVYLKRGANLLDPDNFKHLRLGDEIGYFDPVTGKIWNGIVHKAYSDGELEISFTLVNPKEWDEITLMIAPDNLAQYKAEKKLMVAL